MFYSSGIENSLIIKTGLKLKKNQRLSTAMTVQSIQQNTAPEMKQNGKRCIKLLTVLTKNGYVCLPNDNITELLEFCYIISFIWIEEVTYLCKYFLKLL